MSGSFPELLQEWINWYTESFTREEPVSSSSLLGRSIEAMNRHKASAAFFEKNRSYLDNE